MFYTRIYYDGHVQENKQGGGRDQYAMNSVSILEGLVTSFV